MLVVPFHLDERMRDRVLPVTGHRIAPELVGGGPWERLSVLEERLAREVADTVRPTVISGDCTTSLGVLAGLQRMGLDPAVVWFDGHGDFNTEQTTESGYLGGMPLALAVGRGDATIREHIALRPVPEDRAVLVDARDLDPAERTALEQSNVRRTLVEAVDQEDLPDGHLYVHVDLDVLDPGELTGLRFPAPGGPTVDDLADALEAVHDTGRIVAVGIACTWRPDAYDPEQAQRVLTVVRDVLPAH